jgi:hypothetical protein
MTEIRGNFDDPERKRHALDVLRALAGNQRVTITGNPRSNDKLRGFYFGFVVQPIADHLRGKGHDLSDEQVHHMLMLKVFHQLLPHPDTGEVIGAIVPSWNDLTHDQKHDLIDKASAWATQTLGIKIAAACAAA